MHTGARGSRACGCGGLHMCSLCPQPPLASAEGAFPSPDDRVQAAGAAEYCGGCRSSSRLLSMPDTIMLTILAAPETLGPGAAGTRASVLAAAERVLERV